MSDSNGDTPETIFDIISLGASILDVAVDPWDPWAWVGLLGDIADVALPCVCGLGEAVDVLKTMNVIDDSVDIAKLTENTLDTIKTVAQNNYPGAEYVYKALKKGDSTMLEYVGITNDFVRRSQQWSGKRDILHYVDNLSHDGTRYVEQTVISLFGRKGNTLSNIRNSIGRNGALKKGFADFFESLF